MIVFVLVIFCSYFISGQIIAESCVTPDSRQGQCILLSSCPHLLHMLKSSNSTEDVQFFQRSQCGFQEASPLICCARENATEVKYVVPLRNDGERFLLSARAIDVVDILPTDECGYQSEQRIINGVITGIDEFPWMALLKYNTSRGIIAGCGGVLISKRFVLTAAHCIAGKVARSLGKPIIVTLGEYNLEEVKDCDDGSAATVCNEAIDVPIETVFVHENYIEPPTRRNDIALIRMDRYIAFGLFIAPICLPFKKTIEKLMDPKQFMFISGWGQYKRNDASFSKIKQKAKVPYADKDMCHYIYHRNKIEFEKEEVICAGGTGTDTCPGDSGGPLMASINIEGDSRYYAVGIVSFGPQDCGLKGIPAIYTNVEFYLDWIHKKFDENTKYFL